MSTRRLTDDSANITDGYTYDAFGILINKFGATVNDYLYTGEQYDANIGFYYLRARYYNSGIGRFLTMDTWTGLQFEPLGLHKYLYVHDNPVMFSDPSGLMRPATAMELTIVIAASFALLSGLYVNVTHFLSGILGYKIPIKWNGSMTVITIGEVFGGGYIVASLTGERENEKLQCVYIIVMVGFTLFSRYYVNVSFSPSINLESPGLLGLHACVLTGPAGYSSAAYTVAPGGYHVGGVSISITNMGMGFTPEKNTVSPIYGRDRGVDAMGGWSFLLVANGPY